MRYWKVKEAHVERKVVPSRTICDGCGADISHGLKGWRLDDIRVSAAIGEVYPETDTRTLEEADVCATCWRNKVVPALASVGIVMRKKRADGLDDEPVMDPEQK